MSGSAMTPLVAQQVMDLLGIHGMQQHAVRSYALGDDWLTMHRPFGKHAMRSALAGRYSIDARKLEKCSVGIIDFDVHEQPPPAPRAPGPHDVGSMDAFLHYRERHPRASRNAGKARRMREHVATNLQRDAQAVRDAARRLGAELLIEASTAGLHGIVVCDRPYPWAWVRGLMLRIVQEAGAARCAREGGSLPGTGRRRHRAPLAGSLWSARAGCCATTWKTRRHGRRSPTCATSSLPRAPRCWPLPTSSRPEWRSASPLPKDADSDAAPQGEWPKTFGVEYVDQLLDLLDDGIPCCY